ncbi:MAG: hypothetical protein M3Z08_14305 [Chloroflexota bacterium]|nr:hypothetical protein [Chloroflexota bacterium]
MAMLYPHTVRLFRRSRLNLLAPLIALCLLFNPVAPGPGWSLGSSLPASDGRDNFGSGAVGDF